MKRMFGFTSFGVNSAPDGLAFTAAPPPPGPPEVTSDTTPEAYEEFPVAIPVTYNKPVTVIILGDDMNTVELTGPMPGASFTLRGYNNQVFDYENPTDFDSNNIYDFILRATDNAAQTTDTPFALTILEYQTSPNAFTPQNQTNATRSTLYTSADFTVSGMASGYNATLSGLVGEFQKNGGSWLSSTSGVTLTNADTFKLRITSSSSYSTLVTASLTVTDVVANYNVTTEPDPAVLTPVYRTGDKVQVGYLPTYSFTNVTTYSGQKHLIAVWDPNGYKPTAVTLGGVSGVMRGEYGFDTFNYMSWWEVTIVTGGTNQTLKIDSAGGPEVLRDLAYHMFTVPSSATFVLDYDKTGDFGSDPAVFPTITKPTGGAVLVAIGGSGSPTPLGNLTQSAVSDQFGNYYWVGLLSATEAASYNRGNNVFTYGIAITYSP